MVSDHNMEYTSRSEGLTTRIESTSRLYQREGKLNCSIMAPDINNTRANNTAFMTGATVVINEPGIKLVMARNTGYNAGNSTTGCWLKSVSVPFNRRLSAAL